jgi:hypothetical protein
MYLPPPPPPLPLPPPYRQQPPPPYRQQLPMLQQPLQPPPPYQQLLVPPPILPLQHQQQFCNSQFIAFTPFGNYCRCCNRSLGATSKTLKGHYHMEWAESERLATKAKEEVNRLSELSNWHQYIVKSMNGFCCTCGSAFTEKRFLVRHCKESKSVACSLDNSTEQLIHFTVCGRKVSQTVLDGMKSGWHRATENDVSVSTQCSLQKYIRHDEEIVPYVSLWNPILDHSVDNFNDTIGKMIDQRERPAGDLVLEGVLESAERWLKNNARVHVGMVPMVLPGWSPAGLQVLLYNLVYFRFSCNETHVSKSSTGSGAGGVAPENNT